MAIRLPACRRGGFQKDFPFRGGIGIGDVDLEEKAIKLRFGQGIGPLLLDRILGCQNMERARQVVGVSGDRDMMFLHALQQSGLGSRTGAVDLIRHQQLREDRAFDKTEMAFALRILIQNFTAKNIRWHEIWRKLNALGLQTQNMAQRFDKPGFGQSGHANNQPMTAR